MTLTEGEWNFKESLIGATSGGITVNITPELTDIEVDGKLVKVKGLSDIKTGETATMEINFIELTPEIIKALVVGLDTASQEFTGFNEITSNTKISDGDYISKLAYVGRRLSGEPLIIIFDNALVSGGFSVNGQNKTANTVAATFECVADLDGDFDKLPYHILYPTPSV